VVSQQSSSGHWGRQRRWNFNALPASRREGLWAIDAPILIGDADVVTPTHAVTDTRSVSQDALLPSLASRRDWIGLAVIALPCLLSSMDLTVLSLAVPALSAELKPTAAQLLWIIDIYGFVLSGMLITMGVLGDRIGRRRLLLFGAGAFGVASILAAFSNSAGMLIAVRAVLGIAGATLAPATLSLIRNMFHDSQERAVAIGVWGSSYSAGAAIGPVVGGLLLEHFWWGSVFLVGVPVMVLLLVLGPALLPEYRDPNAGRVDLQSAALSLIAILAAIYGVKRIAEHGFAWSPALCSAAGLAIGWLFFRRQSRLKVPMINLRLFRTPAFSAALAAYAFASFVVLGSMLFFAQYMQLVLGLGPLETGMWSLPFAVAFILGSTVTPFIARCVRPASLMIAGLLLAAIGFVVLSRVDADTTPATFAAAYFTYALGLAPVFTLTIGFIVGCAPPEQAGAASAISETVSEFGGALGIALLGSIGTAVYRVAMARAIPPDLMGAGAGTLGAAVQAAHRIGGALGASLLEVSRAAFMQGLRAVAIVSAVVLVVTAVLVARCLSSPNRIGDGSD
jgi:DHA2 family multidrug resistance protein-like MFS transporter